MNPNMQQIAERLKHYREACGLSQKQVAQALNIDRTTYTKYERSDSEPSLDTLIKIAAIYGVTPMDLLPGQPETSSEMERLRDAIETDSPLFALDKLERSLLARFRVLDADSKKQAIELIGNLSKKG